MDAFWTDAEATWGKNAADYFRRLPIPGSTGAAVPPEEIWRDLDGPSSDNGAVPTCCDRLSGRVSVFEEAARHDPRLGHDLLAWRAAAAPLGPVEEIACRLARLAGTAAHVLDAGAQAARERGYYTSSLLDFRKVQERLAGLVSGAELARLGACRLCRLLERGEKDRAVRETAGLSARAAALAAEVRSVALSVLGPSWVNARLPAGDGPSPGERTRS